MFFPLRLALPVLLLFMQLSPAISEQSIPPDPKQKGTSNGELSVFAIDADPSSATMLPSVTTSDTIVEPNTMQEDLQHNKTDSPVAYVVVFKDEDSLNAAISEIQQNRELSEAGIETTNAKGANFLSSMPEFKMLVAEFPDDESSKQAFVQNYSEGIKDICVEATTLIQKMVSALLNQTIVTVIYDTIKLYKLT